MDFAAVEAAEEARIGLVADYMDHQCKPVAAAAVEEGASTRLQHKTFE